MSAAGKRAGRATTEGKVLSTISGNMGVLVAIGCETEPVSNTREFLDFTEAVLEAVESGGAEAAEGFEDQRLELVGRLGEQVEIRGAARLEAAEGELLAEYVHRPAEKIGVLVRTRGAEPAFARRAEERAIYEQQPDVQSKPEEVRGKIVEGRLRKEFLAVAALAEQQWIHDTSKTVAQALSEEGAEVLEFVRYALAE